MTELNKGPWLAPQSVEFLSLIINRETVVFETGSGGSTLWFAERVKEVLSYENNREWYEKVVAESKVRGLNNLNIVFDTDYPIRGFSFPDNRFNFALVDGRGRVRTVETIFKSIVRGGYIVLDNYDREGYASAVQFMNSSFSERALFDDSRYHTAIWRKR